MDIESLKLGQQNLKKYVDNQLNITRTQMAEEKKEHDDIIADHTTRLAEDKKSLQ